MYDKETAGAMERFRLWMKARYQDYVKQEIDAGNGIPDEKDFAIYGLGVSPESYSRWQHKLNPPDKSNMLVMVVNSGSVEPVKIFGQMDMFGDPHIIELLAAWKTAPENVKEDFAVKFDFDLVNS